MTITRQCTKCKQECPITAFYAAKPSRCKPCCRASHERWRKQNPERFRESQLKNRMKPDYAARVSAYRKRKRREGNGFESERISNMRQRLKLVYKMSVETYTQLIEDHGGLCAICRQPETRTKNGRIKQIAIDHNHVTGEVRGVLCHKCNTGIACFKDDPVRIEAAIRYLVGEQRFKPEPR